MSDSDLGAVSSREAEQSFLLMVQDSSVPVYIWRLEPGERLVFAGANPAADRALGFESRRRFDGMTLEEAFPAVVGTEIPAGFRQVAAQGGSWSASEFAYSHDQLSGTFEIHAYRSSPGIVAVHFFDITERQRASNSMGQSERRLRTIAEQMPCVLWTIDMNLRFTTSYGAGLKALGLKANEVAGMHLEEFFRGQEQKPLQIEQHQRACAGEAVSYETNAFGRSYLTYLEPLRDAAGGIVGALGAAFDITDRKRAEDALQQSESQLRLITSQVPGAIWTTDANLRFTSFYAAERKDLMLKPTHVVGMELRDFFSSEEEKQMSISAHKRACGGETVVYESVVYGREYLNYLEPLRDSAGGTIGVLGIALDLTDRKQAEATLRATEEKYFRFFEENLAGYYLMSPAGKLLDCNPAFARMFGFASGEEALAYDMRLLCGTPAALHEFVALVKNQKRVEQYVRELRRKDGEIIRALENAIGRFDASGELEEIRGYLIDDTEHWKAEEQFRQAQKMEAVGRLAGGVAHDFNNLLTVIKGYSDLALKELGASNPAQSEIAEIRKAADKAADLVQQLLAFSRQQVAEQIALDLNLVINDSARMIERLIGEDILLETRLQPGLAVVRGDVIQMNQILMNLVVNAKDALPKGGRLAIETSDAVVDAAFAAGHPGLVPGEYVLLTVEDSGTGMDAYTAQHIFEPFFTTKAPGEGVGLGLSTVYGIVKQNGGWIGVQTEPGRGTSFRIYWPKAPLGLVASAEAARSTSTLSPGSETILLVEDQEQVRLIAQNVLVSCGYQVLSCGDGLEALQLADAHNGPIDMLVTDVVMPGMSGPELANRLKPRRPSCKVLYMSGYSGDAIARRGVLEARIAYLAKPFSAAELSSKVREVLDSGAV